MRANLLFLYLISIFIASCIDKNNSSVSTNVENQEAIIANENYTSTIKFLSLDTLENYRIIKNTNNGFINLYQIANTDFILFTEYNQYNTVFKYDLSNHSTSEAFKIKSRNTPIQDYSIDFDKREYCFCDTYMESPDFGYLFFYDFDANLLNKVLIHESPDIDDIKMSSCIQLNEKEILIHYAEYIPSNNPENPYIKLKSRYKKPVATIYNLETQTHKDIPIRYPKNYENCYDYTGIPSPMLLNKEQVLFQFPANDSIFIYNIKSNTTTAHLMDLKSNYKRPYSSSFSSRNMEKLSNEQEYAFYSELYYLPLNKIYIRKLLYIDFNLDVNLGEYKYAFYNNKFEYIGETDLCNHMSFHESKDFIYFLAYDTLTQFEYKKQQELMIDKLPRDISINETYY